MLIWIIGAATVDIVTGYDVIATMHLTLMAGSSIKVAPVATKEPVHGGSAA